MGVVLVVEDNDVNRMIAREVLQSLGLNVLEATDGMDALEKLALNSVDVVLMDCQMPVMDGYTTTRNIRQTDWGKKIPIIALTANTIKDAREKCIASGMDDYISKPIDMKLLLQRASSLLNLSWTDDAPQFAVTGSQVI